MAIDYNPCAQKVAEMGYEYARSMNAEICIVHAIGDIAYYFMEYSPIMGFEGFGPDYSFKIIKEQANEAKRYLEAVVKHLADSTIKTRVLDGKTADAILKYAVEYKADLIVMGALTRHGFEKVLGDVSAEVLKNAEIPVLIIPADKLDPGLLSKKQCMLQYI